MTSGSPLIQALLARNMMGSPNVRQSQAPPEPDIPNIQNPDPMGQANQFAQFAQSLQKQSAQPQAPPAPPSTQPSAEPGGLKRFLTNYVGAMGDRLIGQPGKYQRGQAAIKNQQAQQGLDTNEGYKNAVASQYGMVAVPMPDGSTVQVQQKDAARLQGQLSKNDSAESIAANRNASQESIAKMKTDSQERLRQSEIAFRQAVQDRNFELANKRYQEMQRYHNISANLAQGRYDLARESLDYREEGPTATNKTRGQFAATLIPHAAELQDKISKLDAEGKLGPIAGRWEDLATGKLGQDDPEYRDLAVTLGLYATGLMQTHFGGKSGVEAQRYFYNLLNQSGQSGANLNAQVKATLPYLAGYEGAAKFKGRNSNSSQAADVTIQTPDGRTGTIPAAKLKDALAHGAKVVRP